MKIKFYFSTCIIFCCVSIAVGQNNNAQKNLPANTKTRELPENVSEDWYSKATQKIDEISYSFLQNNNPDEYRCYNKKSSLDFSINSNGYSIRKNSSQTGKSIWEAGFELSSITRGEEKWNNKNFLYSRQDEKKIKFVYNHFDIEYLNDESGMRQNFIVKDKQAGNNNLEVKLSLAKKFSYLLKEKNKLYCYNNNSKNADLVYDNLKVWDANGTPLYAYMNLNGNDLSLLVDDKNAVYPITIDPLNHSPEWVSSADGILPGLLTNLQLQVDALYGFNVTGLGDVNGDGYDDVAIGAPAAINIIGPSTILNAGAVFVYFGSDTGLSTTPNKTLRATTAIANALFGFSVAGGNITGNSRKDIIVGAPGDSYSTTVSGSPSTATVTAGKVYVFRGEDMTTSNPSPLLSVYLSGSVYFSRGILLTLGSNITINALFGFSVAATEDMDGDGLGEIIVGAPGYGELGLLPVRSGAAFVYSSKDFALNTPTKLTAPTSSLLGIPLLNNEGLLFGFSVDGVGDYDKDGKPDVIVGAPAGVTLALGNLLGGSAYIYNGNGAGVNASSGTQLKATPSLVGTLANLFGYSVRGVRNAKGIRNGNILVGAPSGNLLSNVLNGLKLKAGSVNVFTSKTSPGSSEYPVQTIQSPRGSSLFTLLSSLNLDLSVLFGSSMDNMLDVNCDGINDIIVGEPLSTSVGIIAVDAVGGSAHIFFGKADGTYDTNPYWSLENSVSYNAGVNAGSLLGYSVAGAGHTRGAGQGVRSLIGAPGAALDFGTGLFNLGNTMGTLFSFAAGNNGLGKSYMFGYDNCTVKYNPDVNVTYVNIPVPGNTNTNDVVPAHSTYGTPVPLGTNPPAGSITMNSNGTYTFVSPNPGIYIYYVPVCLPGEAMPCTPVELTITVLNSAIATNPPTANVDVAITKMGVPVVLKTLMNDRCSNIGCSLNPSSVAVTKNPSNGTATVNSSNGNVTYTPNPGFTGKDTLTYKVCDNGARCATARQIITVYATNADNTTDAADDYIMTNQNISVNGNVKTNDTDAEGNSQTVQAQTVNVTGKGSLVLNTDGSFTFTPVNGFFGPANFPYTTCDNGTPSVCANATLYIVVIPVGGPLATTLTSFTYDQKGCTVNLHWKTVEESNMKEYIVENSINGIDWASINIINPRNNSGNENTYNYAQANPVKGQNYYRITMISTEGIKTYSKVINTNVSCSDVVIAAYPNPFADKVTVYFVSSKEEQVALTLFTNAGEKIWSGNVTVKSGVNNIKLNNLGGLSRDVYIIQIKTSSEVFTKKLVK